MEQIKEYFSPEDMRRILKVSRTTAYKIVKSGQLRVYHIGRLVRIKAADLQRFIEGRPARSK
jgi:putative molybdopterin biosynthesis protein